jgi:hypothetical protein
MHPELALVLIGSAIASAYISDRRGSSIPVGLMWGVVGLILGPFGVLLTWVLAGRSATCEYCRKSIHPDAAKCPYCQTVFE